jgi:hypothetical protein
MAATDCADHLRVVATTALHRARHGYSMNQRLLILSAAGFVVDE